MNYYYKCSECKQIFKSDFIESNLIYLCPTCGKAEKNKPLQGVLEIEYDYNEISKHISRDDFLMLRSGNIFEYSFLLPFETIDKKIKNITSNEIKQLSFSNTSLVKKNIFDRDVFFLDETRNPTYSYKDRASIPVAIKAKQLGITEISAASTGNAGSSTAGICSMLGLKSKIFVPKNIPEAKRIQIQSFGADIFVVDGDYDEAFDLCLEVSNKKKWYNRNTAYNPITIDGKKTSAFDIFIQMKGLVPDYIFVPVGDGVIISGIYKGFNELLKLGFIEKIPKLVAVQAEGSCAVVDYIMTNKFNYRPASTIADSISAGAPRNLFMAAKAVSESKGSGIIVSDDEMLNAQKYLARNFGFLVEPSSAAAFAAFEKFMNKISVQEKVLILLTGSGLKDFGTLKFWNPTPLIKSADEWKNILSSEQS